ncbi:hypothetical protein ACI2L1_43330 [Streptomyces sp. NPDC019531]|uniref:hypothetical protein n=1 Tax=Streptomyces sp. NPDC019531 TaxID=3365062 RepID=UPI0038514986
MHDERRGRECRGDAAGVRGGCAGRSRAELRLARTLAEALGLPDLADVVTTTPTSLRRQRSSECPARDTGSARLGPGAARLGSATADLVRARLDAGSVEPPLADLAQAFRRTDLDRDRDRLSGVLRKGARRLMYVGQISGAPVENGQSEDGTLLCRPRT